MVGTSVVEGVANGASLYKEPSKRNIGVLGQFSRGASFSPIKITSLGEFNDIFGGQNADFYAPRMVKSIFDEAGDASVTLYVARVTNSSYRAATSTLSIASGLTARVTAAYRGVEDPGTWANGKVKVTFYSYGYLVSDNFTIIVQFGEQKQQYNAPTLAELEKNINKTCKFVSIQFTGTPITGPTYVEQTGTIVAHRYSSEVTGTSTSFTNLKVGDVLFDKDNKKIGAVAEIVSATSLKLSTASMVEVSGKFSKRDDKTIEATLTGGVEPKVGDSGAVAEKDFYPNYNSADPKGLSCFDGVDVQILFCAEFHTLSMAKVLKNYVESCNIKPLGIINLPQGADEGTAELYYDELKSAQKSYIASYLGWCEVSDEEGNNVMIPIIAPVLGAAYLRTPYLSGDFSHIPPGGIDSAFNNVISVSPGNLEQTTIDKLVEEFHCNVVVPAEGIGYYVGSSRTYSNHIMYQSVHIRLMTSYYSRILKSKVLFIGQKPNTPDFRKKAVSEIKRFFLNEYDNGALERNVPFDTACKVICDITNNPPTQGRKLVNIDVEWIPTECIESIKVSLNRNDGILTISEE